MRRPRILFLGDSITELGVQPEGYVSLIRNHMRERSHRAPPEIVGAGISGNKVPDLESRLQRDVIDRHPTLVVIYVGINDVWHWLDFNNGTPKDRYEQGLTRIIGAIQACGAHVALCTPSVIGERAHGTNPMDGMLDDYATLSRTVAQRTGAALCDLRSDFIAYLREHNSADADRGILTEDGVHLNRAGNRFVADRIISTLQSHPEFLAERA